MLRIYPVILDWIETLPPLITSIRQSNASLAKQLQRSSMAVALNLSEGMALNDGRRLNAYRIALGEMRESLTAIDIATRLRYIKAQSEEANDRQQKIIATLVNLAVPWKP